MERGRYRAQQEIDSVTKSRLVRGGAVAAVGGGLLGIGVLVEAGLGAAAIGAGTYWVTKGRKKG